MKSFHIGNRRVTEGGVIQFETDRETDAHRFTKGRNDL